MTLPPLKRILLYPLEWLYTTWVVRRRAWYEAHQERRYRAPVPVISVGNLSVGGTGKTPVAIWLIQTLSDQGKRPAYLSRGYGRKTSGFILVEAEHAARSVGDEALMVKRRFSHLPVAVCESRTDGIQRLLEAGNPDVIILDDAFQHLKVQRDLDLIVMDAGRMPDDDYPLPGGRLREPLVTLRQADQFIVNKITSEQHWNKLKLRLAAWGKPVAGCRLKATSLTDLGGQVTDLSGLDGQQAILFSGLGNNDSFRMLAESLGLTVLEHFRFRDHYHYRRADLDRIAVAIDRSPQAQVLTTEKDLMRLLGREDLPANLAERLRAVQIELDWIETPPALSAISRD